MSLKEWYKQYGAANPKMFINEGLDLIQKLILEKAKDNIKNANLDNAMIGNNAHFNGDFTNVSIGDYSQLK